MRKGCALVMILSPQLEWWQRLVQIKAHQWPQKKSLLSFDHGDQSG